MRKVVELKTLSTAKEAAIKKLMKACNKDLCLRTEFLWNPKSVASRFDVSIDADDMRRLQQGRDIAADIMWLTLEMMAREARYDELLGRLDKELRNQSKLTAKEAEIAMEAAEIEGENRRASKS
jgi:hypothetical protein